MNLERRCSTIDQHTLVHFQKLLGRHCGIQKVIVSNWSCQTIITRNAFDISLANFTMDAGKNEAMYPVANGVSYAGPIANGQDEVRTTNATKDLETDEWLTFSTRYFRSGVETSESRCYRSNDGCKPKFPVGVPRAQ